MKWIDIYDIAIELSEKHEGVAPLSVRFTDLRQWVMDLDAFDDSPDHCSEKILEAIQMAWLEELE